MKKRVGITFDLSDDRQRKAYELYKSQPDRNRSEYVIGCILQDDNEMKNTLDRIFEKLNKLETGPVSVHMQPVKEAAENPDEKIPDDLMKMLEEWG